MNLTPLNKTYDRILVGVDDSDDAQLAFRCAIHMAKANHATLIIASIWESHGMNAFRNLNPTFGTASEQAVLKRLHEYQKYAQKQGVKDVKIVTGKGNPGEQIVKKIIPETKPDLLLIGSLSFKGFRKRLGTQAGYMSKYAPISVMVIR